MTIETVEKISGTDVVPVAVLAWQELLVQGLMAEGILLDWEQNALVARDGRSIIGFLLYKETDWDKAIHVALGWVHPDHRRQGVYRRLWTALLDKAREGKKRSVQGSTHVNNKVMIETMAAFKRKPTFISYEYQLDQEATQ